MKPPVQQLLGGLGEVAQSGLFRAAVRNWWLTLPAAWWAYHVIQKRRKAGTLTVSGVLADFAPAVMVGGTLVLLNHTLEQREQGTPAKPSPIPEGATVTDAEFTPLTPAASGHPVIANTEVPASAMPVAQPIEGDDYG